ncbi:FeoC-like transcriptional regulator [Psychromonas sp. SP041]|uniref:FeoC-like transcriptional regulator n=1 Tax=Psychromonas sp. SP041 TaxID=1365007 RepID=UPI0010C7C154|nr:FeoC-like transcriptional regulator [Psychromonas sp. SP041]
MILKRLSTYIKTQQRVDEVTLLKHFHLKQNGLAPMIEILIGSGHVQKTVSRRGEQLSAHVFYSWQENQVIPMTVLL